MKTMLAMLRNTEASTAVEYGLIAGIIAVALISGFGLISGNLEDILVRIDNVIKSKM
ncbi:Flp family type IVb pilin [Rhizobium sp. SSA_523]|uniref:Flp family type IVb pilin n=1 Tax=Rhizobium sp. SSA_523 TaxID=2952477 RepID=UPI002090EF13|nr:Flp family type IVb pilin [Rhizobium sp. SSA_523]MCO5733702.1 Flp family type IVb pilin [Rhizobium sp. SSA_523]WKC23008.1 Flp family type IVb pilin [Rhizobium sp. SSA_523]